MRLDYTRGSAGQAGRNRTGSCFFGKLLGTARRFFTIMAPVLLATTSVSCSSVFQIRAATIQKEDGPKQEAGRRRNTAQEHERLHQFELAGKEYAAAYNLAQDGEYRKKAIEMAGKCEARYDVRYGDSAIHYTKDSSSAYAAGEIYYALNMHNEVKRVADMLAKGKGRSELLYATHLFRLIKDYRALDALRIPPVETKPIQQASRSSARTFELDEPIAENAPPEPQQPVSDQKGLARCSAVPDDLKHLADEGDVLTKLSGRLNMLEIILHRLRSLHAYDRNADAGALAVRSSLRLEFSELSAEVIGLIQEAGYRQPLNLLHFSQRTNPQGTFNAATIRKTLKWVTERNACVGQKLALLVPIPKPLPPPPAQSVPEEPAQQVAIQAATTPSELEELKRMARSYELKDQPERAGYIYAQIYARNKDYLTKSIAMIMARTCEKRNKLYYAGSIYHKLGLISDVRRIAEMLVQKGKLDPAKTLYGLIGDTARANELAHTAARVAAEWAAARVQPPVVQTSESQSIAMRLLAGNAAFTPLTLAALTDASQRMAVTVGFDYSAFRTTVPKLDGSHSQLSKLSLVQPRISFRIPRMQKWFFVGEYLRTQGSVSFPVAGSDFEAQSVRNFAGAGARLVLRGAAGTLSLKFAAGPSFNQVETNVAGSLSSTSFGIVGQGIYVSPHNILILSLSGGDNPYMPMNAAADVYIPVSLVSDKPTLISGSFKTHKLLLQETETGVGPTPNSRRYSGHIDLRFPLLTLVKGYSYAGLELMPSFDILDAVHGKRKRYDLAIGGFLELGPTQVIASYKVSDRTFFISVGVLFKGPPFFTGGSWQMETSVQKATVTAGLRK